jgi:hypothetical protein
VLAQIVSLLDSLLFNLKGSASKTNEHSHLHTACIKLQQRIFAPIITQI